MKLSVVLAVRNEEKNLARCLESVKNVADEIVVVDEHSEDKTVEIAKKYGARVYEEPHHDIFHITKQIALDYATGDWMLQLDADEEVIPELAKEIEDVVKKGKKPEKPNSLFLRHQMLIEKRDGKIGKNTGEIVGYFISRKNIFLGKPLMHGGSFPDGVIRLVKKGSAYFPGKSVHEQIQLDGEVSWLKNSLNHYDSPTLSRYFIRMNRYTDLHANELRERKSPKSIFYMFYYSFFKPIGVFISIFFIHRGYLDGIRGFLWSFFSAMHYPVAYFKYLTNYNNELKR